MSKLHEEQAGLSPVYLATLVCSMGMMGFVALAGPLATALGLGASEIGFSAMAGGLGWVLSARAWGRMADRLGRRRVIIMGVSGFTVFYLALCLVAQGGAAWGMASALTLAGLILARFAMGLTYSAVPAAANAMIADRFSPAERVSVMGRLGAAQAAGLLLGPAFIALTAGPSPVLPLFLMALLPLPVLLLMALRLPPDRPTAATPPPPLPLMDHRLRGLVLAALIVMSAVGIAQIVVGFVALDRLGLDGPAATRLAGTALSAVGVVLILAQLAIGLLNSQPAQLIAMGAPVAAVGFACAAFAPSGAILVAAYALAGFGVGWVFPAISAMAANAVNSDEQGRAAGSISTAVGLGAMIGPAIGGVAYGFGDAWPFAIAALLLGGLSLVALKALGRT